METPGDRIRKVRTEKNLSRAALGRAVGLAYSTIADIENGYQFSSTRLHRIAEYLGVSVEYLESGTPDDPPTGPKGLSKRERELIQQFRDATPDGKRAIEGAAAGVTTPFETAIRAAPARKAHQA